MISLKGVCKSYGGQRVLEGFDLEVYDGGRLAIMGRSGSGKTTVLNIVLGLIKPDSGEIIRPSGKIGVVFQEDRLIEGMSAEGNLKIVLKKGENLSISKLLSSLGISGGLEKKPTCELSGGEKRRVAIARALIGRPDVVILDEPFKGIDEKTLPLVYKEINQRTAGKTLILVTHSRDEAKALGCEIVNI